MSKARIVGKTVGMELDKRFYMPGIKITGACPKCKAPWSRDMGENYLGYPTVGKPMDARGYCSQCDHEWPVMVIVWMTLELAPT